MEAEHCETCSNIFWIVIDTETRLDFQAKTTLEKLSIARNQNVAGCLSEISMFALLACLRIIGGMP